MSGEDYEPISSVKPWFQYDDIMDALQESGHPQAVKAFLFLLNGNKILRKENGRLRNLYLGSCNHLAELEGMGKQIRKLMSRIIQTEGKAMKDVKQQNRTAIKNANKELVRLDLPTHTLADIIEKEEENV